MATPEQVQMLIELFQKQNEQVQKTMDKLVSLQEENAATNFAATRTTFPGTTVQVEQPAQRAKVKTKRPERPEVNAGIDDRDWALFQDSWKNYKFMCELDTANIGTARLDLRACCSADVNKLLFEFHLCFYRLRMQSIFVVLLVGL